MIESVLYNELISLDSPARSIKTARILGEKEFEFVMHLLNIHIEHLMSIKEKDQENITPGCQVYMEDYNGKPSFFTVLVNAAAPQAFIDSMDEIRKSITTYAGKYIFISAQASITLSQNWEGINGNIESEMYTYKIDAIKSTIYTRCGVMDYATEIKSDGLASPVILDTTSEFDQLFEKLL